MSEILSQNEIDSLLSSISSGSTDSSMETQSHKKRIKIYDFRRPDKFSMEQIKMLQIIHERFARRATQTLSSTLKILTGIHVASVDQLTYEEFIRSIPSPTTFTVFNPYPLKGMAVLEIDPVISYTIIDKMLGGSGRKRETIRTHTELEITLLEDIVIDMLQCFADEWRPVFPFIPRISSIETNPHLGAIVPPNEMVVLVTFETKINETEGMINLCLPYLTIEAIIPFISEFTNPLTQRKENKTQQNQSPENRTCVQRNMFRIKTPLCSWSNLSKINSNESYQIESVQSNETVFSPAVNQEI